MIIVKNLVLVGMMGSGKTTIGEIVAKKLDLEFIDIDKEIEELENCNINKIFELKGEKYFRQIEEEISINKIKLQKKVISLGGGGFLNNKIKKSVLNTCLSFWLDWSHDELIKRLIKSKKRPKVKNINKNELKNMIKERNSKYNHANFRIKCDDLTKFEIADKVIKIFENEKN